MAATKKKSSTTATQPVDVPALLLSQDGNKTVARAKAAVAKKWSLSRAESIFDASDLTWFLLALRRDDEARELSNHIAERVRFGEDKNLWLASSFSLAVAARLSRMGGDDGRRASLVARLAEHPAVPASPSDVFVRAVAEASKDIRSAEVEPSQKWALQHFARGCARATYFQEAAAGGVYDASAVDRDALEHIIAEGLDGLRAHLAR